MQETKQDDQGGGVAKLLLKPHHQIAKFASADESRYAICGVHFNIADRMVEATNGRLLMRVPFGDGDPTEFPGCDSSLTQGVKECTVPSEPYAEAFKAVSKNQAILPVLQTLLVASDGLKDGRVSLTANDLDTERIVNSKCIPAHFPTVAKAIHLDGKKVIDGLEALVAWLKEQRR